MTRSNRSTPLASVPSAKFVYSTATIEETNNMTARLDSMTDDSQFEAELDEEDTTTVTVETKRRGPKGYVSADEAMTEYVAKYDDPKTLRRRIRRYCRKHEISFELIITDEAITLNGTVYTR